MITRKEYMANLDPYVPGKVSAGYRRYYAQFVTDGARQEVLRTVGPERLLASTDPYLNDISLSVWDRMAGGSGRADRGDSRVYHVPHFIPYQKIKEAGDGYSLSVGVSILKEAARQWLETEAA